MKRVELIVCIDDGSWKNQIFVEIPDQMNDVDMVAVWVVKNIKDHYFGNATYIGVYNWDARHE